MSSSELSDLSSALSSEDENIVDPVYIGGNLEQYFQKDFAVAEPASPPPKKKRPASPPHDHVLADNPDITVSHTTIYFCSVQIRVTFGNRVAYACVI